MSAAAIPSRSKLTVFRRRPITGETVASVMLASGSRALRNTRKEGRPRGLFCGIGVCYDCLVVVDGRANVRACMTRAVPGMKVRTQQGIGGEEGE